MWKNAKPLVTTTPTAAGESTSPSTTRALFGGIQAAHNSPCTAPPCNDQTHDLTFQILASGPNDTIMMAPTLQMGNGHCPALLVLLGTIGRLCHGA